MTEISWKQLKGIDLTTIASDPAAYVRAVFLKKDWNRLLQLTFDPLYADYVVKALKVPFVRRQLFIESTADAVLSFLDEANDVVRRQTLLVLVQEFTKLPVALSVGQSLLQSMADHPWAQSLTRFVFSLQSDDFIRRFMKGEARDVPGFLTADRLLPMHQLSARKSIGTIVVDHYLECLKTPDNSDAATRAAFVLEGFRPLWKENRESVDRLKAGVRSYKHRVSAAVIASGITSPNFANCQFFPVGRFYDWGLIDDEFVLHEYLLTPLIAEKDLAREKQELTQTLARIVTDQAPPFGNLIRTLASIGAEEPENVLGEAWKRIEDIRGFAFFQEGLTANGFTSFGAVVNAWMTRPEQMIISSKQFLGLSTDVVRLTLDYKPIVMKVDPARYTHLVTSLLQAILGTGSGNYGVVYWSSEYPASRILPVNNLELFSVELSDELVREAILEPTGSRPLNAILAQQAAIVPLTVSLLIRNLNTLARVIDHGHTKSVHDEFGFIPEFSFNFPPLSSSPGRKAEPWTGSVHVFERTLIKKRLLQHTDISTARFAFQLYKFFTLKCLHTAHTLDDKKLLTHAIGVHFRFCRFLLGKAAENLQIENQNSLIEFIVHPLILSVGARSSESFATELFNSLIISYSTVPTFPGFLSPLFSVVHRLIEYSSVRGLEEGETIAASLVTLTLDRLFHTLVPSLHGLSDKSIYDSRTPDNCLAWTLWLRQHAASKVRLDEQSSVIVPSGFRNLILRHYFGKKAANTLKITVLTHGQSRISTDAFTTRTSAKVLSAVIGFIGRRLESYTDEQFQLDSTTLVSILIKRLKNVISPKNNIELKAPSPANAEQYIKKHTLLEYQYLIKAFKVHLRLSKAFLPLLQSYAELADSSLFSGIFSNISSQESYATFQKVFTFSPMDPRDIERQKLGPYGERTVADYAPKFIISIIADQELLSCWPVSSEEHSVVERTRVFKPGARKLDKLSSEIAAQFVAPILRLDGGKLIAEGPDPQSLLNVSAFCATTIADLVLPRADVSVFGHILKVVVADMSLLDPEPTEENSSPTPSPVLFPIDTRFPAPKHGPTPQRQMVASSRGIRRRFPIAPRSIGKLTANKYLLAVIMGCLRKAGLIERLDFDLFADELLGLLELPDEKVLQKLGDDNAYFFANEVVLFVLGKIKFEESVQPLTSADSANKLIQVYYRLLSSSIFHHPAADALFQYVQAITSHARRQSIISQFLAGFFTDKFTFTMHTRINLTMWALSPVVVGFPLPEFSLTFAGKIAEDEKLHPDVRRSILASTVAYFKYQETSKSSPVQVDSLFAVLDKTVTPARDSLTPTCIWAIRSDLGAELRARSVAFQELLPRSQDPAQFAAIPGVAVAFPKTGEWRAFYGRYVSSYVGAGLLTHNSQLLLLVIAALTQLCTETTEVSSKIDPFIRNGLSQIEPGRPSAVLLRFAFHFCFTRANSVYERLIDSFVDLFARLRNYLDSFVEEHMNDAWEPEKAAESAVAMNTYIGGFTAPIPELLERGVDLADANEAEWIQTLAKRIETALQPTDHPTARIAAFDELRKWMSLLASDEVREAIPIWKTADAWGPILRLARTTDPFHPLLGSFFRQAQPLPIALLQEIAAWPTKGPRPGDAALMPFIRPAVVKWLATDVETDVRRRVLAGLWRFSAF
jgi:hypothetical protein